MAEVVTTNQFKTGMAIEIDGQPFTIVEFQHVKPGKGGAFVRTKVRNIATGAVLDKTFRAGEKFERMHTQSRKMAVPLLHRGRGRPHGQRDLRAGLGDARHGRGRRSSGSSRTWRSRSATSTASPFDVQAPNFVELAITQSDPGVRGDTAQGGTKPATLETGVIVQVPLFIEEGERIKVDTRTREYLSRA